MSDYNNDSKDDLPYDDEGVEGASLRNDQYADGQNIDGQNVEVQNVEGQYSETQYAEQPYVEGQYTEQPYVEPQYADEAYVAAESNEANVAPENTYYTNEYQKQDYYQNPEDGNAYEQVEPNIFVDPPTDNYTENADVYSTELPSYTTQSAPQYENVSNQAAYTDQNQVADAEGYVAADDYLEPNNYADQGYTEPDYANAPEFGDTSGVQAAPAENFTAAAVQGQVQGQPLAPSTYDNGGYSQAAYDNIDAQRAIYDGQGGSTQYEAPLHVNPAFANSGQAIDDQSRGAHVGVGSIVTAQTQPDQLPPDFRQEYVGDAPRKSSFSSGWAAVAVVLFLAFGSGAYFLYNNFSGTNSDGDIPVLLADKTEFKTFPSGSADGSASENGTKSTDRLPINGVTTADGKTSNLTQPTLLDSREDVVDQTIKSEDRIETAENITADNEDKDIQNVLTLIKSSANNVEILLKPEDVTQLDQNQIAIDGLETILVAAKPVKLADLIAAASQSSGNALEKVEVANVDELPVVAEGNGNPFADVIANAGEATSGGETIITSETALPLIEIAETIAANQPSALPETNPNNLVNIASNDSSSTSNLASSTGSSVAANTLTTAPKPAIRPFIVPEIVPENSLPPVIAASGGAYGVQLASLPSESAARQAYASFTARFPNILSGYTPIIQEAVIPGRGVFYRVIAGPLINSNDASQLCANLRAAGLGDCLAKKI